MNATATPVRADPALGEARFLVKNVSWDEYQTLLRIFEEKGTRVTYDRGSVELMSPLIAHERYKSLMGYMVEAITDELDLPRVAAGSTTLKSELLGRGLEPDECYYLANANRLRGMEKLDFTIDPPPDLALEVEITSPLLDKDGIYAALGVPEIWRHDGEAVRVLILGEDGLYAASETSLAFPFLPMAEISRFLAEYDATNDTKWGRGFRAWVRDVVAPRFAMEAGDAEDR